MTIAFSDLGLYAFALLVLFLTPGPVWLAMRAMQWKPRAAKDSTRATSLAHSGA